MRVIHNIPSVGQLEQWHHHFANYYTYVHTFYTQLILV